MNMPEYFERVKNTIIEVTKIINQRE